MTAISPARQHSRSPPAGQHRAGTPASSARIRPGRSSALSALPDQIGPLRLPSPWPSWPRHSRLRIRSRHPAGEWLVLAIVRRLEEHGLPELVVAAIARDSDVSHAPAAPGEPPEPARRCTASSSSAPCLATAGDRTGSKARLPFHPGPAARRAAVQGPPRRAHHAAAGRPGLRRRRARHPRPRHRHPGRPEAPVHHLRGHRVGHRRGEGVPRRRADLPWRHQKGPRKG